MTSLQVRLSVFLSLAIVVLAIGVAAYTFFATKGDAHLMQDKQLRQTAELIGRIESGPITLAERRHIQGVHLDERLVVRFLRDDASDDAALQERNPLLSNALPDGLQTVMIDGETWRVFVRPKARGMRIAVAQQTKMRDAAATRSALRALVPFAVFAPLLLLLVGVLVRRMFLPLRVLSADLKERSEADFGQLSMSGLPSELEPLIGAMNRLLTLTELALAQQGRFVADAAHELRSPLTAMSLQAERLAAAEMSDEARQRMGALAAGLQRTREMLEQLLALARSQAGRREDAVRCSLQNAVRAVLEDLMPLAQEKNIDVGVVETEDLYVEANPLDLKVMIKNLLDNAIRYTPQGGKVDIKLMRVQGAAQLTIDDSGPGIPQEEIERVFDPFYRVLGNGQPGSGLGLAIVRAIAGKLGAAVALFKPDVHGVGIRAVVRFQDAYQLSLYFPGATGR
jgi:two-component system OmpR family sensor kinase